MNFMKRGLLPLLTLIVICIFTSCKKSPTVEENTEFELTVNLNSIYKISNVKTAVFEGWVDAESKDLDENLKRFYAVYRSNDPNIKVKLKPGLYTVLVEYNDFFVIYREKVDLKTDNKVIDFYYNKKLDVNVGLNRLIYLPNESNIFSYGSVSATGGTIFELFANGVKTNFNEKERSFIYSFSELGKNYLEFKTIYLNGEKVTDKYEVYVVKKRNIDNIWNSVSEKYIKQKIFNNRSFVSFARDTTIMGSEIKANPIIDGIYGFYKFNFSNDQLKDIEVEYGNINMDANLRFWSIKNELQSFFGVPIKKSEEHYIFNSDKYTIDLSVDAKRTVVVRIAK